MKIKGIFSDSNNIFSWHELEDINKKSYPNLRIHVMHDYVLCSHRLLCCIVLCTRLCENCSHFILKLFQPNSFEEVCFLMTSYKNMQKSTFWKFWEHPLFDIREYAFNGLLHLKLMHPSKIYHRHSTEKCEFQMDSVDNLLLPSTHPPVFWPFRNFFFFFFFFFVLAKAWLLLSLSCICTKERKKKDLAGNF